MTPRPISLVVSAVSLLLLGAVIAMLSLAPWVHISVVGGGGENVAGSALDSVGWLMLATGALLAAGGAAMLATRRAIVGSVAIPAGAFVLFIVSHVREDLREVRGYLRVEGSTAGISSPITRAAHHRIAAANPGGAMRISEVAAVLAICAGAAVIAMRPAIARQRMAKNQLPW